MTVQTFRANAARTCQSEWDCAGIQPETIGAMVSRGEGAPPAMFCEPCTAKLAAEGAPQLTGSIESPSGTAEVPQVCGCSRTDDGFTNRGDGIFVHAWCGLPRPLAAGIPNGSPTAGAALQAEVPDLLGNLQQSLVAAGVPVPEALPTPAVLTELAGTGDVVTIEPEGPPASAAEPTPVPGTVHSNMPELRRQDAVRHAAKLAAVMAEHGVDEHEAEAIMARNLEVLVEQVVEADRNGTPMPAGVIACGPPEKRPGPGRPPKAKGPLEVEKRDDHKWCVVHRESGTLLLTMIPSKAKATPYLGRLAAWPMDWATFTPDDIHPVLRQLLQNEQLHVHASPLYREGLANELTSTPEPDTPTTGHDSAHAGLGTGAAAGPVGAAEGTGGTGDEGSGGPEETDHGAAVEVDGGGPVGGGELDGPNERGPALPAEAPDEVGPLGPDRQLPGDSGAVQPGGPGVVPGAVVTDGQPGNVPVHDVPQGPVWSGPPMDPTPVPASAGGGGALWTGPVGVDPVAAGTGPGAPADVAGGPDGGAGDASWTAVDPEQDTYGPAAGQRWSTGPSSGAAAGPADGTVVPAVGPVTTVNMAHPSPAMFMSTAKHTVMAGNTPWAASYANELREIVKWHAEHDPRSLQRHLGPSEIGHQCHRQVVGKLAGVPQTNHVVDVWPSWMGRAGHKAMEELFGAENTRVGWQRWFTERRVEPHPEHAGTSDLYDAQNRTVLDHKFLGDTQMAKLRGAEGPPIHYQFQLKLYARGYRNLGYPVDRIVIIGWPRTGSSIDGMFVWAEDYTPAHDDQLAQLFALMEWRQQFARAIESGAATMDRVPASPDSDECYFCPFYRPQSARDGGPGCPGHAGL